MVSKGDDTMLNITKILKRFSDINLIEKDGMYVQNYVGRNLGRSSGCFFCMNFEKNRQILPIQMAIY